MVTLPEGGVAVFLTIICSLITVAVIKKTNEESEFLINIFVLGLLARILFGTALHVFDLRDFFGGDAYSYDFLGNRLTEIWSGQMVANDWISQKALQTSGSGWGMNYLTGFIYFICGRNILAAQFFCAVIGAATAPMVYACSYKVFKNQRVSRTSALLVTFFPAFIIWSSQLLKDGLIIFLLVLAITMVLQLQEKFEYWSVIILIFSLFGIISLRFYIFYMVAIAVVGSFIIGTSGSVKSTVRGVIALVAIGIALTYLGVLRSAGTEFDKYGSLDKIQASRQNLSTAESGFGEDADVSTTEGALVALPVGFMYLMLAPFPWQATTFRQAITLPEILLWWATIPIMLSGLWFTLKNRLRNAISILIFTLLLTIAYSIFQGNVGTAYRQRAQIQVFLFIFIAVGWTLLKERRENRMAMKEEQRYRLQKKFLDKDKDK